MIVTNADGTTITACPLSENSARSDYVEMFSAGWHDQHNFHEPFRSRAISVEFVNPDHEDYTFTWLEMVAKPALGLVAGKQFEQCNDFK